MRSRWSSIARATVALLVTGVLVAGSYAFTAANTVPSSRAGDGTGTVSGYTLTDVHYNLNATNPANVDSVTFTLDAAPPATSTLKAQLVAGGSWYSCTNAGANVTCATASPQATVLAVNQLRVIAAD